jgi:hypothetical protein
MMKSFLKGPWVVFSIVAAFILISSCATAPPAKEEAQAPPVKAEAKAAPAKQEPAPPPKEEAAPPFMTWTSDADGVADGGEFTRTATPAFTLEYPEDFVVDERQGNDIVRVKGPGGLPVMNIAVDKVTGDIKEFLQGYANNYAKVLETIGTDVEIIYNKPLPEDTYGEEFLAQEFEVEWMFGGSTLLTSYINVIVKEGYWIALQGHVMGDIDELKGIYETIDLEP